MERCYGDLMLVCLLRELFGCDAGLKLRDRK